MTQMPWGDDSAPLPEAQPLTDPATPFTVQVGQPIRLVLAANPTTGYHWVLANRPNPKVVRFVSKDYVRTEGNLPGAGGQETWRFAALAAGRATITLRYVPPGRSTSPGDKCTFTVRVE